jgi:hypothetical protein
MLIVLYLTNRTIVTTTGWILQKINIYDITIKLSPMWY